MVNIDHSERYDNYISVESALKLYKMDPMSLINKRVICSVDYDRNDHVLDACGRILSISKDFDSVSVEFEYNIGGHTGSTYGFIGTLGEDGFCWCIEPRYLFLEDMIIYDDICSVDMQDFENVFLN